MSDHANAGGVVGSHGPSGTGRSARAETKEVETCTGSRRLGRRTVPSGKARRVYRGRQDTLARGQVEVFPTARSHGIPNMIFLCHLSRHIVIVILCVNPHWLHL